MELPVLTLSLSLSTLGLAVALPKEGAADSAAAESADAIAHTAAENADAAAAVYCG